MPPDPKTKPEDLLAHMTDRQLAEKAVRTADHAYHVATYSASLGRDNQRTLVAVAKRVGVLEKDIVRTPKPPIPSDPNAVLERFATVHLKREEQEIELRRKKWDTTLHIARLGAKWLFGPVVGAVLYAVADYLLG